MICAVPLEANDWIQNAGNPTPLTPLPAGSVPTKDGTPELVPDASEDSGDRSNLVESALLIVMARSFAGATSTDPIASTSRFWPTVVACKFKRPKSCPVPDKLALTLFVVFPALFVISSVAERVPRADGLNVSVNIVVPPFLGTAIGAD